MDKLVNLSLNFLYTLFFCFYFYCFDNFKKNYMHIFSKQSLISSEDIQLYLSNITGLNQENANSKIFFFLSSLFPSQKE